MTSTRNSQYLLMLSPKGKVFLCLSGVVGLMCEVELRLTQQEIFEVVFNGVKGRGELHSLSFPSLFCFATSLTPCLQPLQHGLNWGRLTTGVVIIQIAETLSIFLGDLYLDNLANLYYICIFTQIFIQNTCYLSFPTLLRCLNGTAVDCFNAL